MLLVRTVEKWAKRLQTTHPVSLDLILWNGQRLSLHQSGQLAHATIQLKSRRSLRYLWPPSLDRMGQGYVEGEIDIEGALPDIVQSCLQLVSANPSKWGGKLSRAARIASHTRAQDRQAIAYHYDVGNDFYKLWLDENLVYSCAYFERGDESLAVAQEKKIDHILTKLNLQPGERLLDVGCGWGALALRAAQKFGAQVHGITLSAEQYAFANARVQALNLADRIRLEIRDYRALLPQYTAYFDKITSVGMFEHVGLRQLHRYFNTLHQLLKNGGLMLNHGITSTSPKNNETPYGGGAFIDRYVFPHGELAHIGNVLLEMQKAGLEVCDVESLRKHYARTLEHWTHRFEAQAAVIRDLVGEKRFRIWRLYLAGCAQGFERDWVSIFQILACKAGGGTLNPLPWSRRYQYTHPISTSPVQSAADSLTR